MESDKISIVICHKTGRLIERCLDSLKNIPVQKIVVTSDDSFNSSLAEVYHLALDEPTYKRNWGATIIAKNEYIVFMDDDVEVEENAIENMARYLDNNLEVGMAYALLYKIDNHNKIDTSGSFMTWCGFLNETYLSRKEPIPILAGKSALCIIRKSIFSKIKGFDGDFVIYGEETDLSWRVWLAGYKTMVLPSAIGYHAFETALKPRSYYNQYYIHYHGCKNYLTMLIKNLPASKLYIALLNASIWLIIGILMWFRNKQASKWIFAGIQYNINNIKYIWQKRQEVERIDNKFFRQIYKNPSILYYLRRCRDYLVHRLHG